MSSRPNTPTETRRKRHKPTVDGEESRRRRSQNMEDIRKSLREETLFKKRLHSPLLPQLQNLHNMVDGVHSDDNQMQLEAATQFRKLLSLGEDPPIEQVVQTGVVPRLVEFLKRDDFPHLQFEAAWTLSNIAFGTTQHTQVLVDHGVIPVFINLLTSPSDKIREQAAWALGNIAGDSPECRDLILQSGAMSPLLAQLNTESNPSMLQNLMWTLSNLCRGKPSFDEVKPAVPALAHYLVHSSDEEVLSNVCWAFCYLSDDRYEKVQAVAEAVSARVLELLMHSSSSVRIPALGIVSNILSGEIVQTQFISAVLPFLLSLLIHDHNNTIKKEACRIISKITAWDKEQIQAVIEVGLIKPLLNLLQTAEFDLTKAAACAVTNAICLGTDEQIKYIVNEGCTAPICDLLTCPDPRMILICLESLDNMLKAGRFGCIYPYTHVIEEANGLEKIKGLMNHENRHISVRAKYILKTYWAGESGREFA